MENFSLAGNWTLKVNIVSGGFMETNPVRYVWTTAKERLMYSKIMYELLRHIHTEFIPYENGIILPYNNDNEVVKVTIEV